MDMNSIISQIQTIAYTSVFVTIGYNDVHEVYILKINIYDFIFIINSILNTI